MEQLLDTPSLVGVTSVLMTYDQTQVHTNTTVAAAFQALLNTLRRKRSPPASPLFSGIAKDRVIF